MRELTLYVGGDDSNHAGETKGEIIVSAFSFLDGEDGIVHPGNKRDCSRALSYVSKEGRDWRFTIRAGDQHRRCSQNVPIILPTLISHYIHSIRDSLDGEVVKVCAFADGEVQREEKTRFIDAIMDIPEFEYLESVSILGFVKKRVTRGCGFSKSYECPRLVWVADSIASWLFRNYSIQDLFKHSNMIVPYVDK
ncbi:MAG: hypothetical protein V1889_03855 [archaeon]